MTDYREADFSRLKTVPVAKRPNKVDTALLAKPPVSSDRSFAAFLDALPSILAAQDLRYVVDQIVAATGKRAIVAMLGGHVIKVGLGPLLIALLRRRAVSIIAMNGSAAIHDFELAAYGGTSEDVAAGLGDGTFGMAEETGREMNAALARGANNEQGAGEALAEYLRSRKDLPGRDVSVLVACAELGVPVTVHAAIGAEIIHQHPSADGAVIGATSHRDFKRLAGALPDLDNGGVVLNLGSAVVMPEVFLKALTVARNLNGGRPKQFTACDCDMQRHYRPRVNVVERPTLAGGRGIQLTGHHEILFPLIAWSVTSLDGRRGHGGCRECRTALAEARRRDGPEGGHAVHIGRGGRGKRALAAGRAQIRGHRQRRSRHDYGGERDGVGRASVGLGGLPLDQLDRAAG